MESLRRSVSRWGMVEPLVVRRSDQLVIGGHQRLEAARALGLAAVPVVYVEASDAEAKALNLALNRIQGEWDLPKLGGCRVSAKVRQNRPIAKLHSGRP